MGLLLISFEKYYKTIGVAILAIILLSSFMVIFRNDHDGKTFISITILISAYYSFRNLNKDATKDYAKGLLIGEAALLFMFIIQFTFNTIHSNEQFDFMCFYMQGQLGVHNMNFYDPHSFQILLEKVNYPGIFEQNNKISHFVFQEDFKNEILNVGLLSPPITMLYFAPLASFDYQASRTFFSVLVFIFIILNAFLANIVFLKKERSIFSFLLIFIIIAIIPGTYNTIRFVQTNFFILFLLLLTFHKIDKPISGFYLALSIIFKPITGILLLYFIINKRWKSVSYFLVSIAILFLITCYIWGFENLFSFFVSPPTLRLPYSLYMQDINQSLIALLNRNLELRGLSNSGIEIIYFGVCVIMTVLTIIASKKLQDDNPQYAFLAFIPFMLMIYPSSLTHYSVYLIPILLYFVFLKKEEKYLWIMIIPSLIFLNSETFFSYLIIWTTFLFFNLFLSRKGKYQDLLSE